MAGIDQYTKLMLHGDESPLVDSSLSPYTLTLYGSVVRSATAYKFGGYSIYFDGSTQRLTAPNSTDWTFGTGDFTIDFWVYSSSYTEDGPIIIRTTSATSDYTLRDWGIHIGGGAKVQYRYKESTVTLQGTTVVTTDVWHHVAIIRYLGITSIYLDGDYDTSIADTNDYTDSGQPLIIGAGVGAPFFYSGYIDEIRVSKGIARWTSSFTPPTSAYSEGRKFISGTLTENARLLVFDESDWSIVNSTLETGSSFDITLEDTITSVTVAARSSSGEILAYGNVVPEEE